MHQEKRTQKGQADYLPALTWLRGLSALLVVVSHSIRCSESLQEVGFPIESSTLLSFLDLGAFAVCVFFTLSGATLYLSSANSSRPFTTSSYLLKRWLRIWPAFILALIVYGLFGAYFRFSVPAALPTQFTHQFTTPVSVIDTIKYVTMTFNITGPGGLFNNAFWTIPVEFTYYLMLPFLLFAMRYIGVAAPILLACVMFLISRTTLASLMHDPRTLMLGFTFCGGVVLGSLKTILHRHLSSFVAYTALAITLLLAIAITQAPDALLQETFIPQKYISLGILSVVIVGISLFSELHLPDYAARKLSFLGKTSYSIYLFHNLFLGVFTLIVLRVGVTSAIPIAYLAFVFTLTCTLPAAYLSYSFVEEPAILTGRRLAVRLAKPA